ncbi:MAG: signal peptidase I [Pseudomonadota bacterium]
MPLIGVLIVPQVIVALMGYRSFELSSGSMKPTLERGDVVLAKPLGRMLIGTLTEPPERGAVLVLTHPKSGLTYASRVIGLPGETIELRAGQVHIDGVPVPQRQIEDHTEAYIRIDRRLPECVNSPALNGVCRKHTFVEALPGGREIRVLDTGETSADDTRPQIAPPRHVYLISDHRDNAVDSRISRSIGGLGPVPFDSLTHRVELYWLPRDLGALWASLDRVLEPVP